MSYRWFTCVALFNMLFLLTGPGSSHADATVPALEGESGKVTVTSEKITLHDGRQILTENVARFTVRNASTVVVEGSAQDNKLVITGRGGQDGGVLKLDAGPEIEFETGFLSFVGGGGFDVLEIDGHSRHLPEFSRQRFDSSFEGTEMIPKPAIAGKQISIAFFGDGDDEIKVVAHDAQPYAYYSVECPEPRCGVLQLGSNLTTWFEGLAPVIITGVGGSLLLDGSGTPATTFLTIEDDLGDTAGVGGNVVTGDGGWETVNFAGFFSLTVRSGTGDEVLTLASLDPAGSLTEITLDGDDTTGTDTGNDVINVIPLSIPLTVTGGSHTTGDVMVVDAFGASVTDTGTAIQTPGFADISYSEIESVVVYDLTVHNNLDDTLANLAGDGELSLRESIELANNPGTVIDGFSSNTTADTIAFDAILIGSTITLTQGELTILQELTIDGPGADLLTISGGGTTRLFSWVGGWTTTINGLTLADGNAVGSQGGAIKTNGGTVNLTGVIITNNQAQNTASSIYSAFGTLNLTDCAVVNNIGSGTVGTIRVQDTTTTITNTTISGNTTRGISAWSPNNTADSLTLTNVTITDNSDVGVNVILSDGTLVFEYQNSIFSNNGGGGIVAGGGQAASITITSLGNNILDDTPSGDAAHTAGPNDLRNTDPLIDVLSEQNGTFVHALLASSPAIDQGNDAAAPVADQRGVARVDGDLNGSPISDIGAFEFETADLHISKTDGVTAVFVGQTVTYTVVASNSGPSVASSVSVTDSFPGVLTCTWTSIASGGATGNGSGSGDLAETLVMPVGSAVTYTAPCTVDAGASGTLTNTANISSTLPDQDPGNNSASDSDTFVTTKIIFVDIAATTGGNIGTSWTDAFLSLQDALLEAVSYNQVWVAEGVYFPDVGIAQIGNAVSSTFSIGDAVEVYGGFSGVEPSLGLRDPAAHVTVLSGDIDGDDVVDGNGVTTHFSNLRGDNAWHVLTATGTTGVTVIDGFSITGGRADGGGANDSGAALVCDGGTPTLGNLHIIGNRSLDQAALSNCPTTITSSVFESNRADQVSTIAQVAATYVDSVFIDNSSVFGGGLFQVSGGNLTMTNCQITDNQVGLDGILDLQGETIVDLDNVLFSGNKANRSSAIRFAGTSGGSITNSTFSGHRSVTSPEGAVGFYSTGNLQITSSIFWNNLDTSGTGTLSSSLFVPGSGAVTVTASVLQGSGGSGSWTGGTIADGGGNLDEDPLFVQDGDPSTAPNAVGDFHLLIGSAAIDAGDNSAVTTAFDLDGETRTQNGDVDMGPYEGGEAHADLSISKTDGVTSATPGGMLSYTIVASNNGPSSATTVSVTDTFPADLSCSWTSAAGGGATGNGSGSGNISESLFLPSGGSVAYTATCTIDAGATGTLSNTASLTSAVNDPNPGNNSATDSDTVLAPEADLQITKDDGMIFALPGDELAYTIVVSNAGPSDVVDAIVEDLFPAELIGCQSICAASPGASCVGTQVNGDLNDMPDLQAGSEVTYFATCTVDLSASFVELINTATVAAPAGVTDPIGPNSASDTNFGPEIFADGFESGDTSAWPGAKGPVKRLGFASQPGHELLLAFEVDLSQPGQGSVIGLGHRGQPLIRLDLAVQPGELLLSMATRLDDGSWTVADPVLLTGHGQLELEWRRAWRPGTDNGELYLTARGTTVAWLVDLDNDEQAVREVISIGELKVRRVE